MSKKPQFSTRVDEDTLNRARATVAGMQRISGPEFTFSVFAQAALDREAERLEAEFNGGRRFPLQGSLLPGVRVGRGRGQES